MSFVIAVFAVACAVAKFSGIYTFTADACVLIVCAWARLFVRAVRAIPYRIAYTFRIDTFANVLAAVHMIAFASAVFLVASVTTVIVPITSVCYWQAFA